MANDVLAGLSGEGRVQGRKLLTVSSHAHAMEQHEVLV